jgi:citrate synthase
MSNGLDGLIVADTVISHSDAQSARLWMRGRPLEEAVRFLGYEGTVALLWSGFAGENLTRDHVVEELGVGRRRAFDRLDGWLAETRGRPFNEATRLCLANVPDDSSPSEIVAALAVGVAAMVRFRQGLSLIPSDPVLTTAADFLLMMSGETPAPDLVRALETYFTVAVENGLGPSTFAARITASTGASLASAAVAAYCAFSGPLHGGAPGDVLAMLDAAKESGDVDGWLDRRLAAGERLVGFGNRAFPNGDPRAALLAEALREITGVTGVNERILFAADFERRALEAFARQKPGRRLCPNLELNAALLLDACGIPEEAFTPTFAIARVAGWLAHAMEQKQTGRMIRPKSRYVGPALS